VKTLTNGCSEENFILIKFIYFILQGLEMTFLMFTPHLAFIQVN